jgi:hypothetical protein
VDKLLGVAVRNRLNAWRGVLLNKLMFLELVREFPSFETQLFITVLTTAHL